MWRTLHPNGSSISAPDGSVLRLCSWSNPKQLHPLEVLPPDGLTVSLPPPNPFTLAKAAAAAAATAAGGGITSGLGGHQGVLGRSLAAIRADAMQSAAANAAVTRPAAAPAAPKAGPPPTARPAPHCRPPGANMRAAFGSKGTGAAETAAAAGGGGASGAVEALARVYGHDEEAAAAAAGVTGKLGDGAELGGVGRARGDGDYPQQQQQRRAVAHHQQQQQGRCLTLGNRGLGPLRSGNGQGKKRVRKEGAGGRDGGGAKQGCLQRGAGHWAGEEEVVGRGWEIDLEDEWEEGWEDNDAQQTRRKRSREQRMLEDDDGEAEEGGKSGKQLGEPITISSSDGEEEESDDSGGGGEGEHGGAEGARNRGAWGRDVWMEDDDDDGGGGGGIDDVMDYELGQPHGSRLQKHREQQAQQQQRQQMHQRQQQQGWDDGMADLGLGGDGAGSIRGSRKRRAIQHDEVSEEEDHAEQRWEQQCRGGEGWSRDDREDGGREVEADGEEEEEDEEGEEEEEELFVADDDEDPMLGVYEVQEQGGPKRRKSVGPGAGPGGGGQGVGAGQGETGGQKGRRGRLQDWDPDDLPENLEPWVDDK